MREPVGFSRDFPTLDADRHVVLVMCLSVSQYNLNELY